MSIILLQAPPPDFRPCDGPVPMLFMYYYIAGSPCKINTSHVTMTKYMKTEISTKADMETTGTTSELLVIGPGELGARVATLWKSKFPNAQITLK